MVIYSCIMEILAIDKLFRKPNVSGDLFKLDELSQTTGWKYELPTLVSKKNYLDQFTETKYIKSINKFKKNFHKENPLLLDLDFANLCIAGGAISSTILDNEYNDVDFFVYGVDSDETALSIVTKLVNKIKNNAKKIKIGWYNNLQKEEQEKKYKDCPELHQPYLETECSLVYSPNCISIYIDKYKFQIILRIYNSISEVLHGFDLGASAVGFDGSNVYFTSLSKFCYENMANIYDGSRRSTTYEKRLVKYFNKGFSIILPDLSISKLKVANHKYNICEACEMPYLTFTYSKVMNKIITVDSFFIGIHKLSDDSDYDLNDSCDFISVKRSRLYLKNLETLIKNDTTFVYYKDLQDTKIEFNNTIFPYDFVVSLYDKLAREIRNGKLMFMKLRKYINVVPAEKFGELAFQKDGIKQMLAIIEEQQKIISQKCKNTEVLTIKWNKTDPMTQLTSSFNPVIEDDSKWYGEYYNKLK